MEKIRCWVRDKIGYRSWLYQYAAHLLDVYFALRREGLRGLALIKMNGSTGQPVPLNFRALDHPILVQPGTEDVGSIINNIFREEYGQLPRSFVPRTIVDAGAYIGDTAAYYLSRFSNAWVIALEPNDENYQCASRNLAPYGKRVMLLKRALWDRETVVRFSGQRTGASISEIGAQVQTETIPALMMRFDLHKIDILKLDIEGAESTVIPSGVGGWLRNTKMLLLETHGTEIEDAVLPVLLKEGFLCKRHRNVWYCTNGRIS